MLQDTSPKSIPFQFVEEKKRKRDREEKKENKKSRWKKKVEEGVEAGGGHYPLDLRKRVP